MDRNVVGHIHCELTARERYGARKVDRVKSGRQRREQHIIAGINEGEINARRDSNDIVRGQESTKWRGLLQVRSVNLKRNSIHFTRKPSGRRDD